MKSKGASIDIKKLSSDLVTLGLLVAKSDKLGDLSLGCIFSQETSTLVLGLNKWMRWKGQSDVNV